MTDDDGGSSPWGQVSRLSDVLVAFVDLPSGTAWWDPDEQVILLQRGMSRRETRCALAHELEHIRHGDEAIDHVSDVLATRQEIAAHTRAARRLIPLDALIDALLWSQDEQELAEGLNVTVEIVRQRLLTLTPEEHAAVDRRIRIAERQMFDEGETA